jgi:hypothetical protein
MNQSIHHGWSYAGGSQHQREEQLQVKPLRPFKISVYNRAAQQRIGEYVANEVPRKGDLLSFYGNETRPGDAYHLFGTWQVDVVMWEVAHAASVSALEIARESDGYLADSFCVSAEIHVWPAQGPHWYETPKWAKAVCASEDDDDEPEDES